MKPDKLDLPDVTDASAKEKTGKTLKQWFEYLDARGGLEKGRRDLVNHLYAELKVDEWWATTIVVEYERARGQMEKDGKPTGYSICATKTLAAPLADVYAAWTSAKALDAWMGPKTKIAFEDGGKFENADGDRGTFQRIREDKDLRFAWEHEKRAPQSQVEVMFADKGKGKTGITLNHTRIQTRREADEIRSAWGRAFEALKARLEKA
jgi:uncharacterized protein YndB with AHSA1/START domain